MERESSLFVVVVIFIFIFLLYLLYNTVLVLPYINYSYNIFPHKLLKTYENGQELEIEEFLERRFI